MRFLWALRHPAGAAFHIRHRRMLRTVTDKMALLPLHADQGMARSWRVGLALSVAAARAGKKHG